MADGKQHNKLKGLRLLPDEERYLEKLTPNQRLVMQTSGKHTEIAEKLGWTLGRVKSTQNRARTRIAAWRALEVSPP